MTEKEMDWIVEEVVRQIQKIRQKKRVLVLVHHEEEENAAQRHLAEGGLSDWETDRIWTDQYLSTVMGNNNSPQALMENYDGLLIGGVTLKQLVQLKALLLDDPISETMAEFLRTGKPVTVVSSPINCTKASAAFSEKIAELKKTLKTYGMVFVEDCDLNKENMAEAKSDLRNRWRIDKRVIAKQDLKDMADGELEIREDTVFTTTAKELLAKKNIHVCRCRNEEFGGVKR